jgi:hypothetical protein
MLRVLKPTSHVTAWMAGTSPAMTRIASIKRLYPSANAVSRDAPLRQTLLLD